MEIILSLNCSHHYSFTVYSGNEYYVYELDKILGVKNTCMYNYEFLRYLYGPFNSSLLMKLKENLYKVEVWKQGPYLYWSILFEIINVILYQNYGSYKIKELILVNDFIKDESSATLIIRQIKRVFNLTNNMISLVGHHQCHALNGLYFSPYEEALVITVDGAGKYQSDFITNNPRHGENDLVEGHGMIYHEAFLPNMDDDTTYPWDHFVIWYANKNKNPVLERITTIHSRIALFYEQFWMFMDMFPCMGWGVEQNYPGKLMGLSSYGNSSPGRVEQIKNWINTGPKICDLFPDGLLDTPIDYSYEGKGKTFIKPLNFLDKSFPGQEMNLNSLTGFKQCADFACDVQLGFNQLIYQYSEPYINRFKLPIIFSGGSALNVICNQFLLDKNFSVSIPPSPNDAGNSLGAMFHLYPPKEVPSVYLGVDILDRDKIEYYKNKYFASEITIEELVRLIIEGKIIGIINGRSEIGPRALGNRSIICDPSYPDMKDILNKKVKFREDYRPFAPAVRYEDRDKYFNFTHESPYMSFCPTVKPEYWDKIPSVVHVDKTARIQTVRKEQHELFYSIMTEMERVGKIPIILNTSFNIKGKPILSTLKGALHLLETTELDYVYCEGFLYAKKFHLNMYQYTTLPYLSQLEH